MIINQIVVVSDPPPSGLLPCGGVHLTKAVIGVSNGQQCGIAVFHFGLAGVVRWGTTNEPYYRVTGHDVTFWVRGY